MDGSNYKKEVQLFIQTMQWHIPGKKPWLIEKLLQLVFVSNLKEESGILKLLTLEKRQVNTNQGQY